MRNCFIITLLGVSISSVATCKDLTPQETKDSLKTEACESGHIYLSKTLEKDWEKQAKVPSDEDLKKEKSSNKFSRLRFAYNRGWSWRTGKMPEGLKPKERSHIKGLRSGGNFGLNFHYFVTKEIGIGFSYNSSKAESQTKNIAFPVNGSLRTVNRLQEDIFVKFYGPSLMYRIIFPDEQLQATMKGTLGYLSYSDIADLDGIPFSISGESSGLSISVGLEYEIMKKVYLGAQLSTLIAYITQIEISGPNGIDIVDLEDDQIEDLSRIDLSFGVRVQF